MQRRSFLKIGPAGSVAVIGWPALAQSAAWPLKEITLIMPVGAGGGSDLATRPLAAKRSKLLGMPVLVKNMPSTADGYTIGSVGTFTLGGIPRVMSVPFDKTSFEPLGCWGTHATVSAWSRPRQSSRLPI